MPLISSFRHEGMTDLVNLLGSMVDTRGKILIPGLYDSVADLTDEERKQYDSIDFDLVSVLMPVNNCLPQ